MSIIGYIEHRSFDAVAVLGVRPHMLYAKINTNTCFCTVCSDVTIELYYCFSNHTLFSSFD